MSRYRRLSKRTFAEKVGKSPRTIERWIATGIISNNWVLRDVTGHIFINEIAIEHLYSKNRKMESRYV